MSARAARSGLAWAALVLLGPGVILPGQYAQAAALAEESSTRPAEVTLDYIARAPEISTLRFLSPPGLEPGFQTALSYYHPLILHLDYTSHSAGPVGRLDLPGERRLRTGLLFSVYIAGERRILQPGSQGVVLTTTVGPGSIREDWVWPDGVILNRAYYQSAGVVGSGMRCVIHNQGRARLKGVRLEARLRDPEISETRARRAESEADDEIAVDPRHATLYLRDYLRREESWLGMGWSEEGGLITAGESSHDETIPWNKPDTKSAGLVVGMETPAQDLAPGQYFKAVFWMTWGPDRETVTARLDALFNKSGYYQWEEEAKKNTSRGVQFHCEDKYLVHLFQSIKGWANWMVRPNYHKKKYLYHLVKTSEIMPSGIIGNMEGFLILEHNEAIQNFLDHWLDQRTETPEVVATIILACQYFFRTQDKTWQQRNVERILELTRFLADLDHDQDGLPDYQLPAEVYTELYPLLSPQHPAYRRAMSFSDHALDSLWALRLSAEFLRQAANQEFQQEGDRFLRMAGQGEKTLEKNYWQAGLGQSGFYAYSRLVDTGFPVPYQGSGAIRVVRAGIGDQVKQKAVFLDLWNNPAWRTSQERYRYLLGEDKSFPDIRIPGESQVDFFWTHEIFKAGLLDEKTAEEAVRRLLIYARGVVLDPEIMGLPGRKNQKPTGAKPAALSYFSLIFSGLGGLIPQSGGMRVVIPAYPQDLGVKIKRFPYQGAFIDLTVKGPGGGTGTIIVNGKRFVPGGYLTKKVLASGRVRIEITRKSARKRPKR